MFPDELVERPILASCPEWTCSACGAAWRRTTLRGPSATQPIARGRLRGCRCAAGLVPGVVLDPFMGSGTTAVVARRLGRSFVGIELSDRFRHIAERRLRMSPTGFSKENEWGKIVTNATN